MNAPLRGRPADEVFAYYREQVEDDEDYVGYSEWTLKRAVTEAASGLPGIDVIDLGCGPNPVTLFDLHARRPELRFTAVDLSAQYAASAKRNADKRGVSLETVTASVHETGLPASSFDGAILAETLEHIPDEFERSVLAEARRLLRDGGWLIVSVPNARSLFERYMTWRRGAADVHPQHLREYTPDRLRDLLVSERFEPQRALRVPPPPEGGRAARLLALAPPALSLKAAFVARAV